MQQNVFCRTKESEDEFKDIVKNLKQNNFSELLKNDMSHFLPSEVDKLYHRNVLTSNSAETTFSVLKNIMSLKTAALWVIIEVLMYISISWITDSLNTRIVIPNVFEGLVNPLIGKKALDYLKFEYIQSLNIIPGQK